MRIDSKHIEIDIDCKDWILGLHIQISLYALSLIFIAEKFSFQFYEIQSFSILALLR